MLQIKPSPLRSWVRLGVALVVLYVLGLTVEFVLDAFWRTGYKAEPEPIPVRIVD